MTSHLERASGLKSLINKYRKLFRTPENLNHYSDKDYKEAERKFLKFSLFGHSADSSTKSSDCEKSTDKS